MFYVHTDVGLYCHSIQAIELANTNLHNCNKTIKVNIGWTTDTVGTFKHTKYPSPDVYMV